MIAPRAPGQAHAGKPPSGDACDPEPLCAATWSLARPFVPRPNRVVCAARRVAAAGGPASADAMITGPGSGMRSPRALAASGGEQRGDEHVGQPVLAGVAAAAWPCGV